MKRFITVVLAVIASWCTSTGVAVAQKQTVIKERPMPMAAPLFLESETYTSTLYLVNQLNFGVQADVTLYDMGGLLLTTKHLYLEPNSHRSTSIKQVLSDGGLFSQAGSVEVVSPENASALLGQLSITRSGANPAYLDEELFMPSTDGSKNLLSVIDSPENSPIVAITNVSTMDAQTLHIQCVLSSGSPVNKSLTIQPKQTQLVRACSEVADTVYSPDAVDSQFILGKDSPGGMSGQHVAGIAITTDGPVGELAAFGFVEHQDAYGRYFSAMNFADPKLLQSSGTVFTGVPVGPSRLLSGTSYMPQVALTNFSATPQTVTVSLATSTSGLCDSNTVATTTVAAGSSKLLSLEAVKGDEGWQNSFIVRSTGQPGDVVSKMMFKGSGLLPNIELIGKDEHDTHNTGDHPWTTENGVRSTLFLFNHSTTQKSVTVRLGSGTEVWLKMYDLHPNETTAISINDIVASGTPDGNKHTLSKVRTTGEVAWWSPSSSYPEVTGRVVQIDGAGSMARNFSCGGYTGECSVGMFPVTLFLDNTDVFEQDNTVEFCTYSTGYPSGCVNSGQPSTMQAQMTYVRYLDNANIGQIMSTSGAAAMWQGIAVGRTTAMSRHIPPTMQAIAAPAADQ